MSQIATVKSITGTAFVVGLDGQTRPLKAGDKILKGETIVTGADGRVELAMEGGGQPLNVGQAQTVKVEDNVAEATRPEPPQATTASGTVDSVIQALEQGGDLNQQLEATAAGAGGGGGEGGGSSFVRLLRISEGVDPLAYQFSTERTGPEFGPQNEADFVATLDILGASVFESSLDGDKGQYPGTKEGDTADSVSGAIAYTPGSRGADQLYVFDKDGLLVNVTNGGTVQGDYGTLTIVGSPTGGYTWTYQLDGNIRHGDAEDRDAVDFDNSFEDDLLPEGFVFQVREGATVTAEATLTIAIGDDGPQVSAGVQEEREADIDLITDDTDLRDGGSTSDGGSFGNGVVFRVVWGADGPQMLPVEPDYEQGYEEQGFDEQPDVRYSLVLGATDSGLVDNATDRPIELSVDGSGNVMGTVKGSGELVFMLTIDANGHVTLTQFRAIEHGAPGDDSASNDEVYLAPGVIGVRMVATDSDGDRDGDTFDLGGRLGFGDDEPTVCWPVIVEFVEEESAPGVDGNNERYDLIPTWPYVTSLSHTASGNIQGAVNWGADGFKAVTGVTIGGHTVAVGAFAYLDASGNLMRDAESGEPLSGDVAPEGAAASIIVDSQGHYTIQIVAAMDHAAGDGENFKRLPDVSVTAVDGDGDPVTLALITKVKDDVPDEVRDIHVKLEEESVPGLNGINEDDGRWYQREGNIRHQADWGADGFGGVFAVRDGGKTYLPVTTEIESESGTTTARLITIHFNADGEALSPSATSGAVTLVINADTGAYTITVNRAMDHSGWNSQGENELYLDDLSIEARDGDGDPVYIRFGGEVRDDRPEAANDSDSVTARPVGPAVATGNVLTDAAAGDANDSDVGADRAGADGGVVGGVMSGSPWMGLPVTSGVNHTVYGQYGKLVMEADGDYTYTLYTDADKAGKWGQLLERIEDGLADVLRRDDTDPALTDTFTYTLKDGDGDTVNATLTVSVHGVNEPPTVVVDNDSNPYNQAGRDQVKESGLASGSDPDVDDRRAHGEIRLGDADGLDDIQGIRITTVVGGVTQTHNFSDEQLEALPSGGLSFNTENGTVTLLSYSNGVVQYRFELTSRTTDVPNQVEDNRFTVAVTDDNLNYSAPATAIIDIVDDRPTARDDKDSATAGGPVATGNVITDNAPGDAGDGDSGADTRGADGASVAGVSTGDVGTELGADVGSPVFGSYGQLVLQADGHYEYRLYTSADLQAAAGNATLVARIQNGMDVVRGKDDGEKVTDTFSYTLKDGDGDWDNAKLTVTVWGVNDPPTVVVDNDSDPSNTAGRDQVQESGLASGSDPDVDDRRAFGEIRLSDADGLDDIQGIRITTVVGGVTQTHHFSDEQLEALPSGGLSFNTENGTVTLLSYSNGVVQYRFELTSRTTDVNQGVVAETNSFTVAVTDNNSSYSAPATAIIDIVDDTPTARNDSDGLTEGLGQSTDGNVITGLGTVGGLNGTGADTRGADGASVSAVTGYNGSADSDGSNGFSVTGRYGVLTMGTNGQYTYTLTVASVPEGATDSFSYTLTDGDGDPSPATLTIQIAQDGRVPVVSATSVAVDEEGLPNGTAASGDSETGSGSFTVQANGEALTALSIGGETVNLSASGPQTVIDNAQGTLKVTAISGPDGSGAYTVNYSYTLKANSLGHSVQGNADTVNGPSFTISATDATGDTRTNTLQVVIGDDAPMARHDSASVTEGGVSGGKSDVVLVIDNSGSMAGTNIAAVKAAVSSLFASGKVNSVFLVSFGSDAAVHNGGQWYADLGTALAAVNALSGNAGNTDYDAAISTVMSNDGLGNGASFKAPPAGGSSKVVMFLSDGEPNQTNGTGSTGIDEDDDDVNNIGEESAWINYLQAHGFAGSFAFGFGGLDNGDRAALEPIAWTPNETADAPYDADGASGVNDPKVIIVANPADLGNQLQGAIPTPSSGSGNVLTDGSLNDSFGADGGRILSVSINGTTYTWNGQTGAGAVITKTGAETGSLTGVTSVTGATALGGSLSFHFATGGGKAAGDWSYNAPANVSADGQEVFNYVIVDGDNDTSPGSLTIDVLNVNRAPSGTDKAVTLAEDSSYTFQASDFGFSDGTDGNSLAAVRIGSVPTPGTLALDGVPVTQAMVNAGLFVTAAQLADGKLSFTPVPNGFNADGYASFQFQVQDNGGTAHGGANLDSTPNTLSLKVTPVNDGPTTQNTSASGTEDPANRIKITLSGDDVDGTVTHFKLGDLSALNAVGTLYTSGGCGSTVGSGAERSASGETLDLWFQPNSNWNGSLSFSFQAKDNSGAYSASATASITVTAVNDWPTVVNDTITMVEDTVLTITAAQLFGADGVGNSNDADIDSAGFTAIMITELETNGRLLYNGADVTLNQVITLDDLSAGLLTFRPDTNESDSSAYTTFKYKVSDGSNYSNSAATVTINVNPDAGPNASADTVVTAIHSGAVFTIPEWALLRNDTSGPLDVLSITDVSENTDRLDGVSEGSGNVSVDTAWHHSNAGKRLVAGDTATFSYEVSDGNSDDDANVTVRAVADADIDRSAQTGAEIIVDSGSGHSIKAGSGDDVILANGGNDTLVGGKGNDILSGGSGDDVFKWSLADVNTGATDVVTDFNPGASNDVLDLRDLLDLNGVASGSGWTGNTATLAATLQTRLTVSEENGHLVLSTDPDGAGGAGTQKIVLQGLDGKDFVGSVNPVNGVFSPADQVAILKKMLDDGNLKHDI